MNILECKEINDVTKRETHQTFMLQSYLHKQEFCSYVTKSVKRVGNQATKIQITSRI